MLMLGFGVYQSLYQKLQLLSLLLWVQARDSNPIISLQGTNFAIQQGNNFLQSFGIQFVLGVIVIVGFMSISLCLEVNAQQSTLAILLNRKRYIFPTRIYMLVLPMLLFSSVNSIASMQSGNTI
jgi:hypothetical protein